ncbi:PapI protein [Escherichia coli]|nr:PapI protein [Escherichia coli]TJA44167.1 PapI protein [Escherichia coli]TJE27710.1 PapI protein [Escherichia coli]TJE45681.1 PapI protein [Escherichia coli]TJI11029.1 PapI protein [Escherichia coli]
MLPSEIMIWQPEFTDKILSRKPGAVQSNYTLTRGRKKSSGWEETEE